MRACVALRHVKGRQMLPEARRILHEFYAPYNRVSRGHQGRLLSRVFCRAGGRC